MPLVEISAGAGAAAVGRRIPGIRGLGVFHGEVGAALQGRIVGGPGDVVGQLGGYTDPTHFRRTSPESPNKPLCLSACSACPLSPHNH
jgi:hypothetical protein